MDATSTVLCHSQTMPDNQTKKRRRRTNAGGASDDCFTCTKQGLTCNRLRPYCDQCLRAGVVCSGYRTQLTWGIGVASRGKLRGQTLPVAKTSPRTSPKQPSKSLPRTCTALEVASKRQQQVVACTSSNNAPSETRAPLVATQKRKTTSTIICINSTTPPTPLGPFHDSSNPPTAQSWSFVPAKKGWNNGYATNLDTPMPGVAPFHDIGGSDSHSLDNFPSIACETSPPTMYSMVDAISSLNNNNSSNPFTQFGSNFAVPALPYQTNYHYPTEPHFTDGYDMNSNQSLSTSCPSLTFHTPAINMSDQEDTGKVLIPNSLGGSLGWAPPEEEGGGRFSFTDNWQALGSPVALQPNQSPPQTMAFLFGYYSDYVCPLFVLVDGPHNPFRNLVLQLARSHPCLEHAICALAACSLRVRGKICLGRANFMSEERIKEIPLGLQSEAQCQTQEQHHQELSMSLLCRDLEDAAKAREDFALVTLFLICQYYMAEPGTAKLSRLFMEAQRLMLLRRPGQEQEQSLDKEESSGSNCFEVLFVCFDAIFASINGSDSLLSVPGMDGTLITNVPLAPGIENVVGCDRQLFQIIRRLAHLNVLSHSDSLPNAATPSPLTEQQQQQQRRASSSSSSATSVLGGQTNYTAATTTTSSSPPPPPPLPLPLPLRPSIFQSAKSRSNSESLFWLQWRKLRAELTVWQFDPARLRASVGDRNTSTALEHQVEAISEAFRYAAMLYTQRLVLPGAISSHNVFRSLVERVIYHVSETTAAAIEHTQPGGTEASTSKFVLWPLFVAGSECVDEVQRRTVRDMCHKMAARTGYMNSLAALDVLEHIWSGQGMGEGGGGAKGPFSWLRAPYGPGVDAEWLLF